MDIQDLLATAKTQTSDKLELKLNALVREHYRFKNLSEANREVVLGIIKKHLVKIRDGSGISPLLIRQELHRLYEDRIKLNLTPEDLKDIKEIIELFEK